MQRIKSVHTVHLICVMSFECYTLGKNGEILKDFKEGIDHIVHFRSNILGTVYRVGWREVLVGHEVEAQVLQLVELFIAE